VLGFVKELLAVKEFFEPARDGRVQLVVGQAPERRYAGAQRTWEPRVSNGGSSQEIASRWFSFALGAPDTKDFTRPRQLVQAQDKETHPMQPTTNRLVSKIHPLTRAVEPEDPMELVATPVEGDPDVMLECLVQEFAWMGWDAEQLMGLFRNSSYPVLNQLLRHYGDKDVRRRVEAILGRFGRLRFRETIVEDPDPEDHDEPELIQLTVRRRE
jgi:hypothetical protein